MKFFVDIIEFIYYMVKFIKCEFVLRLSFYVSKLVGDFVEFGYDLGVGYSFCCWGGLGKQEFGEVVKVVGLCLWVIIDGCFLIYLEVVEGVG